jgi:3',5'-cyclic AMP phosphodiesterase CpdA
MVIPENDANIKRFAIASDSHIGTTKSALETSKKMLETISSVPYNSFFLLGDIVEFGFSFEQWVEAWGILASKETTVPFRPLIGNHDILFGGNKLFDELMGKDYFRIDFDNVHFISLNLPWGIEDFSNKQKQWLETELKSISADDWTIVLTHAFLYASGYNYRGVLWGDNKNAIDELVPLFEETGVDMVFSGHNHQMEHITNNGIEYFITGVFGSYLDEDREFTSEGSQWYNNKTHGYVDLAVGETSATTTFLDANGEGLYSYALEK